MISAFNKMNDFGFDFMVEESEEIKKYSIKDKNEVIQKYPEIIRPHTLYPFQDRGIIFKNRNL